MPEKTNPPSMYDDLMTNLLKNFVFFPTANLQRAISPTLNFGCNIGDVGVEQSVLAEVGSYGKQLNRILDLLMVILPRVIDADARAALTPGERRIVDRFEELARRADEAAAAYQGKPRQGVTRAEVDHLIECMRDLEKTDNVAYIALLKQIHDGLPAPKSEPANRSRP